MLVLFFGQTYFTLFYDERIITQSKSFTQLVCPILWPLHHRWQAHGRLYLSLAKHLSGWDRTCHLYSNDPLSKHEITRKKMRSKTTPSEIVFHLRSSEQFLQCHSIHSNTIKDSLQCAGYIHGRWNPAWDPCWVGSHIAGLERPTPWYNSYITMLAVAAVAHGISQDAAENIAKMWQHPPAAQTSHLWWAARPMRSWSSWCLPVVLILHLKSQNVTKPVPDSFPVRCQNCSFCTTQEASNMLANAEHFLFGETCCKSQMPHGNLFSQSSCVTIKDLSRWHFWNTWLVSFDIV